jgi:hypothetical protein
MFLNFIDSGLRTVWTEVVFCHASLRSNDIATRAFKNFVNDRFFFFEILHLQHRMKSSDRAVLVGDFGNGLARYRSL